MLHAFFLIIHLVIGIAQSQQYDQSLYDGDIGGTFSSTDPSQSNLIGDFGNELAPGIESIDRLNPNFDPLQGNDLNSLRSRLFGPSMERRIFNPFNRILFSFLGPRLMRFQLDMMMQTLLSEVIRKMISPFITNAVGRLMNNDASNNGGIKGGLNLGLSTGQGSSSSQVSIGTGNGNGASPAPQISVIPSQMSNGQIQLIIKSGDPSNGGMTSVALGTPSNFVNSGTPLSGQNLPIQIPQISDNQLQQLMNAQLQQMLINKLPAQLVPQVQQQLQSQIQERIPLLQQQLRLQLQHQLGQQLANQIIPQSTMNGGVLSTSNDGLNQVGQQIANMPPVQANPVDQSMLKLQVNPMNSIPTIHQPNSQASFGNIAPGYSIDSPQSMNRLPDNGPVLQMMVNSAQYTVPPSSTLGNHGGANPSSNQDINHKYSDMSAPLSVNHNFRINTSAHNQVRLEDSRSLSNSKVSFGHPGLASKANEEYPEEKVQISNVPSSNSESDHRGSSSVSITPVFQKSEMNYDLSTQDSIDEGADNSSQTSMANYEHIKETIQQLTGEAQPQLSSEQNSGDINNGTSMEVVQSGVENQDLNIDNHYAKNESNPEDSGKGSVESSNENQDFRSENSNLHPILVYADFPHQQPSSPIDQSMSFSQVPDAKSQLTHDQYSTSSQMLSSSDNSNSFRTPSSFYDAGDNRHLSSYHHDRNIRIPSVSPTLSSPLSYSHSSPSQSDQEGKENLERQKITEDNVYPNSDPQSVSGWADSHQQGSADPQNSPQSQDYSDDKEESIKTINYTPKLTLEQERERKERWQTMLKNLNRYYGY